MCSCAPMLNILPGLAIDQKLNVYQSPSSLGVAQRYTSIIFPAIGPSSHDPSFSSKAKKASSAYESRSAVTPFQFLPRHIAPSSFPREHRARSTRHRRPIPYYLSNSNAFQIYLRKIIRDQIPAVPKTARHPHPFVLWHDAFADNIEHSIGANDCLKFYHLGRHGT